MKLLNIIILVWSLFLSSSCKNPVNGQEEGIANAGPDQKTYVGSYAIFDPSLSKLPLSESIRTIEWSQDSTNPKQVWTFSHTTLQETDPVGFVLAGTYKYRLNIACNSGNVYSDEMTVTVNPRQMSIIQDINLEILIRYRLRYQVGELTASKLAMVDTISSAAMALKDKINGISGIESCSNITYLLLASQNISGLSQISGLTKLEYLNLNQNYVIEDISPIYNLVNLKKLYLYDNPIKNISGLGALTQLRELYLMFTPIIDISSLSQLQNLEILYLDASGTGTKLKSLEPIKNLTKLQQLSITAEGLTDISALENLANLYLLNLRFNKITDITLLSHLKKLERLYIGFNNIDKLAGVREMNSLDFLDAENNKIVDISDLQYLSNIHLIGLNNNEIEDITPIVNNPHIGNGVYIYLTGNPLNLKTTSEYIPALTARGVIIFK